MADEVKKTPVAELIVSIPGLQAVPVVAVRLPNGEIALRHPSELAKLPVIPAETEQSK